MGYRLVGPADAPVVAVMGGISADRHTCAVPGAGEADGWWEGVAGVGGALDPTRWRILGFDWIGGPGDSSDPEPGEGGVLPAVTPTDQANALRALADALALPRLRGVVGASYGGAAALAFAAEHADRTEGVLVIGAAHESHPMATALRVVQRRIVDDALARGADEAGLALARALAMTTYRSAEEFRERFSGEPAPDGSGGFRFPVEDYLDHHGDAFARRFSSRQFLCLSQSLDLHRVDPGRVGAPVTLVAMDPDVLAPAWQVRELHRRLGPGHRLVEIASLHGHDAFLTDVEAFTSVVEAFLASPGG